MPRRRLAVSLFIAGHIIALLVGSIPPPNQLSDPARPLARGVEPLSAWMTPRLDALAAAAANVHVALWTLTTPLRPIVSRYLSATGLEQHWWDPLESTCRHASLSIL